MNEKTDKTINFETVLSKLKANEPFSLSRWGDGEFLCMNGQKGHNCDKHEYFDDLGEELRRSWFDEYRHANHYDLVQPHAIITIPNIQDYLMGREFDSADLFVKASQRGELGRLFAALKGKFVVLIAPKRFEDWNLFDVSKHIVIPDKNCWLNYDDIDYEIEDTLIYADSDEVVILYCAGMMSNVLINEWRGDYYTQIDLGSVLEPYIGHVNRKYHTEIIEKIK